MAGGLAVEGELGVIAARRGSSMSEQPPILRGHNGGRSPGSDHTPEAEALLNDLFDFMRRRLPLLDQDDPVRRRLQPMLPALGQALGRPALLPVEDSQRHRAG